jgi:DNA-binding MarR family transcriptional regulator
MSNQMSRQELNQQSQELITRAMFYHQWVWECFNLNPADYISLNIIMRRTDKLLTPIELAKAIRITAGRITGVVDRLEKAAYVHRKIDSKDRRFVFIQPNAFNQIKIK